MVTFNTSKSFNHNKSKRFLGVEIEVAYSNPDKFAILKNTAMKWSGDVGNDGSIDYASPPKAFLLKKKTEGTSYEIRTAPTNGDLFIKQMMEYGYAFNATNTFANASCGLHVHIDARDLKELDLEKVLMLWSKIEPSMFKLVHPERIKGEWCKPWGFNSDMKKIETKLNSSGAGYCSCNNCSIGAKPCARGKDKRILAKLKEGRYYFGRYKSLNLCSLERHGTLENRMHHGTTNPDTIINWALINASMVDYAKGHSMTSIEKMPRKFDTLLEIISNENVRKWTEMKKDAWKSRPVTTQYQDQIDDRDWDTDDGY